MCDTKLTFTQTDCRKPGLAPAVIQTQQLTKSRYIMLPLKGH